MSNKKSRARTISGDGDPCPRCGRPTEIREHVELRDKQLRQPFYYSRWFNCTNKKCQTTLIMPERFRVWNEPSDPGEKERLRQISEQLGE